MSRVMVHKLAGDLPQFVSRVFDEFAPPLSGKKVLIKPNILCPRPPEEGNTTHPDLVRAAVRECRSRGAADIKVGDCPAGLEGNSTNTARLAGILDASEGHFYPLSRRLTGVPVASRWVDTFYIPDALLEADYVINLAHFKLAQPTVFSGAIKNCYGYLPGGLKAQGHFKALGRRRFSDMLLTLMAVRPPDLSILEGIYAMDTQGPRGGRVRPWGGILAGSDPVALDATAMRLIGQDPATEYTYAAAVKRGLGVLAEEEIEIIGHLDPLPDFIVPLAREFNAKTETAGLLKQLGHVKPVVYREKCQPCSECDHCPAGAITVKDYAIVDEEKCISCFACAEFCPREAIQAPPGVCEGLMTGTFCRPAG